MGGDPISVVPYSPMGGLGPCAPNAFDLFFDPVAVLVVYAVLWLILCWPFHVLPATAAMLAIAAVMLACVSVDVVLMAVSLGAGAAGYCLTRRLPVRGPNVGLSPLGEPPGDDVQFHLWAEQVAKAERSVLLMRRLALTGSPFVAMEAWMTLRGVRMYRAAVTWALLSVSCFLFFYNLAFFTMPTAIGAFVVGSTALMAGMQVGALAKSRRAKKLIWRISSI
jgi:hypothetical protein